MSEEGSPQSDDYVIFRRGGSRHFQTGETPPQLTFLWYLAPLATGVGMILLHVAIHPQPFEPSPWLVILGGWMVTGAGAFVAALAAGAVRRTRAAAGPPRPTDAGDTAPS